MTPGTERSRRSVSPLLAPMDCRSFKKKHDAFLDDTLPGIETIEMQEHVRACARCSRHDAEIRRSLFLLRNLPSVEVSSGFVQRLRARIAVEQETQSIPAPTSIHARGPSMGAFLGVACAVVAVGILSLSVANRSDSSSTPSVYSVTSTQPQEMSFTDDPVRAVEGNVAAPAYAASMSTGMPVWPALLLAEEGSLRFATSEVRAVDLHAAPEP